MCSSPCRRVCHERQTCKALPLDRTVVITSSPVSFSPLLQEETGSNANKWHFRKRESAGATLLIGWKHRGAVKTKWSDSALLREQRFALQKCQTKDGSSQKNDGAHVLSFFPPLSSFHLLWCSANKQTYVFLSAFFFFIKVKSFQEKNAH